MAFVNLTEMSQYSRGQPRGQSTLAQLRAQCVAANQQSYTPPDPITSDFTAPNANSYIIRQRFLLRTQKRWNQVTLRLPNGVDDIEHIFLIQSDIDGIIGSTVIGEVGHYTYTPNPVTNNQDLALAAWGIADTDGYYYFYIEAYFIEGGGGQRAGWQLGYRTEDSITVVPEYVTASLKTDPVNIVIDTPSIVSWTFDVPEPEVTYVKDIGGSAFSLEVDQVDVIEDLIWRSLNITESAHANGAQMTCAIYERFGQTPPQEGSTIVFTSNGIREFAGRIAQVAQVQDSIDSYMYNLHCVDWTVDLDATLIKAQELPEQKAGSLIATIVGQVGNGFGLDPNGIDDGPIHNALEIDLEPASSVISSIAKESGRQWFVDYYRNVHYFIVGTMSSPLPHNTLDIDNSIDQYDSLDHTRDWSQVKNKLYIVDAQFKAGPDDIREIPTSDTKFIPLSWEPWSDDIRVVIDGIEYEILIDGEEGRVGDGKGGVGQCYLCLDNWGIRFPDSHPVSAGAIVDIRYPIALSTHLAVVNQDSIDMMKEIENNTTGPSDGVHETKFSAPNLRLDTEDAILVYAQEIVDRYAFIEDIVEFRSTVQGWRAGQRFFMVSRNRDIPITQVFVRRVQKSINTQVENLYQDPHLQYQIEASSSPYHT